ncbi:hypothetical protein DXH95_14140 [Sphingorhabdus pulchriflava]|uniref:Uncharacterized protein n=1 Tax=Sphingorhabdus pulchriflava TaxID=2292257 RepID=A0A371B1H3_9SPHN|nr:hypothetical protein DXH95_14140 [Sphingorhabdus pulchriflava]
MWKTLWKLGRDDGVCARNKTGAIQSLICNYPFAVLRSGFRCSGDLFSLLLRDEFPVLCAGKMLL